MYRISKNGGKEIRKFEQIKGVSSDREAYAMCNGYESQDKLIQASDLIRNSRRESLGILLRSLSAFESEM